MMSWIIYDPLYTRHLTGFMHPECPERVLVIRHALQKAGLMTQANTLSPRKGTKEDVLLCHSEDYYTTARGDIESGLSTLSTGDVQISQESFEVALYAAGALLTAVDKVMETNSSAFCIVRPPGHHATTTQGMGFCIFNNVAIGCRYVQKKYGIKRVLIVDWDVHHGNGTQEIFEKDPTVFYFSTHQKGIYPGTGEKKSLGCHPIDPTNHSDKDMIDLFEKVLVPEMEKFKPEFVFISCGFDALSTDPLGGLNCTPATFVQLTTMMNHIAEKHARGRIVSALEGGYDLLGIGEAAVSHVQILKAT